MSKFAIAYGMKKRKKMADGGQADPSPSPSVGDEDKRKQISDSFNNHDSTAGASSAWSNLKQAVGYADGGYINKEKASGYLDMPENDVVMNEMAMHEDDKDLNQHHVMAVDSMEDDMVNRIMKKRSPNLSGVARLSKGGMVANDVGCGQDADKMENQFDYLVKSGGPDDFNYTGANSGDELGNKQEAMDRADIVARIMASRKKKDKLPNPA